MHAKANIRISTPFDFDEVFFRVDDFFQRLPFALFHHIFFRLPLALLVSHRSFVFTFFHLQSEIYCFRLKTDCVVANANTECVCVCARDRKSELVKRGRRIRYPQLVLTVAQANSPIIVPLTHSLLMAYFIVLKSIALRFISSRWLSCFELCN